MRCHYEVLQVERTATDDEIKKAYRKMALKHHPDKNPDNVEECTQLMALIQQAYDVLSDSHERAWYDRHRDKILKGGMDGEYEDKTINLYPFFNTTCFKGFGDNDKSFYAVYRDVFKRIAQEDLDFVDSEDDIGHMFPTFGDAHSDYEQVTSVFYGWWQAYSTCRPYTWVFKWDITQAENRQVLRAMEKENKKLRDAARKERNDIVRELVCFVRKRDRRVAAHRAHLEQMKQEQMVKAEEHRKSKIRQRLALIEQQVDASNTTEDAAHQDDLASIEAQLLHEFGEEAPESDEDKEIEADDELYCVACDKLFKSLKQKLNHNASKKHRDAVAALREQLTAEELQLIEDNLQTTSVHDQPAAAAGGKKRKKKRKGKQTAALAGPSSDEDDNSDTDHTPLADDTLQAARSNAATESGADENGVQLDNGPSVVERNVSSSHEAAAAPVDDDVVDSQPPVFVPASDPNAIAAVCDACGEEFPSRSKLFAHLKATGHATVKQVPNQGNPAKKLDKRARKEMRRKK